MHTGWGNGAAHRVLPGKPSTRGPIADCPSVRVTDGSPKGEGRQGGEATRINRAYFKRGDERIEIKQPHVMHQMKTGDRLVTRSGGGAGVGRPDERDPEAVRMDVRNELVSVKKARDVYKVVLNPETLEVDKRATEDLRSRH